MSARPPCLALFKGCRKEWGGEGPWAQKNMLLLPVDLFVYRI